MCGRFVSASQPEEIARFFGAEPPVAALDPSWNVAPTDDVYAVLEESSHRRVTVLRWGLVPSWAEDPKVGGRLINARVETVATKGSFRSAFRARRCIVPADGFYEWEVVPGRKRKQPHYFHHLDGEPLALAGIWEVWRSPADPTAPPMRTCALITRDADEVVLPVHARMPLVLPASAWGEWLDRDIHDADRLRRLLARVAPPPLATHPVSTEVNDARVDGPRLVEDVTSEGATLP